MWCHPKCGLSYCRVQDLPDVPAARTCHACQDAPDNDHPIRLWCGGGATKQGKVQEHAFHIQCWRRAVAVDDEELANEFKHDMKEIGKKARRKGHLSWESLTAEEQKTVEEEFAAKL